MKGSAQNSGRVSSGGWGRMALSRSGSVMRCVAGSRWWRPDGSGGFNHGVAGLTRPADDSWGERPGGYRRHTATVTVGHGTRCWDEAARAVLNWQVKIRSGFAVTAAAGDLRVRTGCDYRLTAVFGPFRIREPVRVTAVVDEPMRCGFAYGTLPGHPVSGEEAFIVHRDPDGEVRFTLRSLTRPSPGRWWPAFPILLVAQRFYRRRYLHALRPGLRGRDPQGR
ncbi:DUF1990 domain-containing protein [Actinoplanes sp. NPDC023801]|uniref:DUF1990 family protein n=1 Tax=Actinoplanes sp. NPDC023801 TaxID=3154595 RepID=UPI0033DA7C02